MEVVVGCVVLAEVGKGKRREKRWFHSTLRLSQKCGNFIMHFFNVRQKLKEQFSHAQNHLRTYVFGVHTQYNIFYSKNTPPFISGKACHQPSNHLNKPCILILSLLVRLLTVRLSLTFFFYFLTTPSQFCQLSRQSLVVLTDFFIKYQLCFRHNGK